MYSYVESKLENCICLECTEPYFADEKHKWGLSPMHYEEKYYISVFNSLYNTFGGIYWRFVFFSKSINLIIYSISL